MRWILCWPRCAAFDGPCAGRPGLDASPWWWAAWKCIAALERGLRRAFPKTPRGELAAGGVLAALLPLGTLGLAAGALWLCGLAHPALRFALEAVWCWQALAMRGLRDESRNVYRALTGGTLEQARAAVARIVGRDTAALSAGGVTKAAVETVAENGRRRGRAMFYMLLGGAPAGAVLQGGEHHGQHGGV